LKAPSTELAVWWRVCRLAAALCLATPGCGDGSGGGAVSLPQAPAGGDGLELSLLRAGIDGQRRVVVDFTIADAAGNPIALGDLDAPPRFVLGWLATDPATRYTRYQSYAVATVAGQPFEHDGMTVLPALESAPQAVADAGGAFLPGVPGSIRYVSGTSLPADFDRGATHTVAAWATRGGGDFVANDALDFVPSGAPVTVRREVTLTADCNECHGVLSAHGGSRREVALCVVCHTDQTIDPETGESLELAALVHGIHRGVELTEPFLVVGFRQSVHEYSEVRYPRDHRACSACHREGPEGGDLFVTQPSRAACGACHDDVDFATGAGHSGGIVQLNDEDCAVCHRPDLVVEFDGSVPGSHLLPYESSVNPELELSIDGVTGMVPGGQPSVRFSIADGGGPVDITTLDRVAVTFAGPTSDYTQLLPFGQLTIQGGGSVPALVVNAVGDYTFTPQGFTLPVDAADTWSVGLEARTRPLAAGGEMVRFGADNPVVHVDVASGELGGGTPDPRREVVERERCARCHGELRAHGELRRDLEYCVLCHHPRATDAARRPGVDSLSNPPESVDFKLMVHRLHRGDELENPYTVYGFGGTPFDFTEVRYPRDLTECEACHPAGAEALGDPSGRAATVRHIDGTPVATADAILTPSMAACLGCHDGNEAFQHARGLTVINGPESWDERCRACHGAGRGVDAADAHAR
jgi:OmcA/MtrC family decaheme c-type cytochrome